MEAVETPVETAESGEEASSPPAASEPAAPAAPAAAEPAYSPPVAGVRGRVPPGGHTSGPFW